jgi:choline dehydrogenase-like flavoprotein
MTIPARARAVIIGGGVSGCSVAYHLAAAGWQDIVLLERRQLTCGTTWHAAGLIGQLRGSRNMTRLAKYSADLYVRLEAETGVATGMRQVGSISVALTADRHHELLRQATPCSRSRPTRSGGCIPMSRPATSSVPCTCRSTGSATRPTSRWRWPRGRGCAACASSRACRCRA